VSESLSSQAFGSDESQDSGQGFILKAVPLRSIEDIPRIEKDVQNKTIVILKVTPLAQKSLDELKSTIEQLYEFATSIGGDIARLGDERIVITPPGVRIWRGIQ
jgi:SepF-like predicted cell division protein (DUF552 family)